MTRGQRSRSAAPVPRATRVRPNSQSVNNRRDHMRSNNAVDVRRFRRLHVDDVGISEDNGAVSRRFCWLTIAFPRQSPAVSTVGTFNAFSVRTLSWTGRLLLPRGRPICYTSC